MCIKLISRFLCQVSILCITLAISSCVSSWKCSHILYSFSLFSEELSIVYQAKPNLTQSLDDQDKLIRKQPSFQFPISWLIWDPMINSPPHKDWKPLSPWWKHKQRIFLSWQWWEISQVKHLVMGNIILNIYTWINSLQQVFFQEGNIYTHLHTYIN